MTRSSAHPRRLSRFLAPAVLAMLAAASLGSATASAGAVLVGTRSAYSLAAAPTAPMVLQNVSLADIVANKRGICNGGFTHVMKNAAGPNNAVNYLNAAQKCGLKVIFLFPETVNHSTGKVYPSKVAYWVKIVKNHPALFGYLTVKEPSWNHITSAEVRSLYAAFHKADPGHPVLALFGDIPHFNQPGNTWGKGKADILVIDWYPVETARNGCSRIGRRRPDERPEALQERAGDRRCQDPGHADLADGPDPQEPRPRVPQEAASRAKPGCASRSATASRTPR